MLSLSAASRLARRAMHGYSTEEKLLALGGLTYVPASILTPVVTNAHLKAKGIPDADRALLTRQEVVRQGVSAAIWLGSYYGALALTGRLLPKNTAKSLWQFVGSVAAATLGHGVLRPIVTNELLVRSTYHAPEAHHDPEPPMHASPQRDAAPLVRTRPYWPPLPVAQPTFSAQWPSPAQSPASWPPPPPVWNRATVATTPTAWR